MRIPRALLLLFGFRNSIGTKSGKGRLGFSSKPTTASLLEATKNMSSNAPQQQQPKGGNDDDFAKQAEQKWSRAANSYVRYFEPMTVVAGRFLLGLLKLRFQPPSQHPSHDGVGLRVLEAGCGAGGLAKELLLDASSPSSSLSISELFLTDLSEGMLDRARASLKDVAPDTSGGGRMPKVAIELADFTAFDRHKFPDGHFDRYYSNLCLHYAENPDKVIQEASRVLKGCNEQGNHGGIVGFTVWGKRAESPVMTIVPDILKGFTKTKAADQPLKKRSPFHMGEDDEALRQRFLRDGRFSKCTVLHYPAVLESLDARDYVEAILDGAPSTKKELEEDYSKEDQQTIRRLVHEKALEILNTGDPLVLDMAMVVAQK